MHDVTKDADFNILSILSAFPQIEVLKVVLLRIYFPHSSAEEF